MATDLHILELGEGDAVVVVHGGFGSSREAFVEQRELADEYRLQFVDRNGAPREVAGRALQAVCDMLAQRLSCEQVRFAGAAHNPQLLGRPFNDRLRTFLRGVTTDG